MKNNIKFLLKLLLILLLTSCSTSSKVIELGEKASVKGMEVSQKALDIYKLLGDQKAIDKSQQDELKVLTDPNPAQMKVPDTKAQDFSQQLAPRIKAYQSLLNTYKAFSQLTDSKYGDKTQEALGALQESYGSIANLPNIPATVSAKLPEVSKAITQSIQAKKIKEHNEVMVSLTDAYILLWDADLKLWNDYIDMIYDSYTTGLNSVDAKKYDIKKIVAESKEPYTDEATFLLLYRLQKRNEIVKQKEELKTQLNDFGKALRELNKAHTELSKSGTNISDVITTLNAIENLIKEK